MQVNCPSCNQSVKWTSEAEYRPFCSKKCQLIDLGDWATEAHTIPSNELPSAEMAIDEEAIAAQYEQNPQAFFKE